MEFEYFLDKAYSANGFWDDPNRWAKLNLATLFRNSLDEWSENSRISTGLLDFFAFRHDLTLLHEMLHGQFGLPESQIDFALQILAEWILYGE